MRLCCLLMSVLLLASCSGTTTVAPSESSDDAASSVRSPVSSAVASSSPAIVSSVPAVVSSSLSTGVSSAVVSSVDISSAGTSSVDISSADGRMSCDSAAARKVFDNNRCLLCHNAQSFAATGGNLNLDSGNVGASLLGRASAFGGENCADERLIDADDIGNSLLLKLVDPQRYSDFKLGACVRNPMPQTGATMAPADVACLESWMQDVADTEAPVTQPDASIQPFKAVNGETALLKAKYLLHGASVTKAELEKVNAGGNYDAVALQEQITRWQNTPQYQTKIRDFLRQSLQMETVPGSFGYRYQLGNFGGVRSKISDHRALWESLNTMFISMTWDMINNDQPFNRIATTRRWKVTTAILVALAYADKENQTAGRVYSELPAKPDRLQVFEHLEPEDFSDWRYVTINQGRVPMAYENSAAFAAEMRAIENNDRIKTRFPRVGFFSAPAFLELWVTNDGNKFRVTASQTLITALDATFSASDATAHASERGIDLDHADPATVCYQCHRLMDPMKLVFSNYQTTNHRSKVPQTMIKPQFAFQGVVEDMATPDDLGRILANHPRFPIAWVQKLCMWGNSQRCAETDPEFKRLAQSFADNNFNFNQLIRDFFSSPLFTATSVVQTHEKQEYLVSISRSNHLCRAIDARIGSLNTINRTSGTVALCKKRTNQLGIIGSDAINRGDADFVQTKSVNAFDAKSIDSQCAAVRKQVFGPNAAKVFDLRKSENHIIAQLTQHIVGLPTNHSRYSKTLNELKRVYNIATHATRCGAGVNPFDQADVACGLAQHKSIALEYVWFSACTSPEFISLGF